jgi:cytidylate kinase
MSSELRIAISGKSGCGNSSVSRIVSARLGLRLINFTFKDLAREKGMSFAQVCAQAELDPQYDLTIDERQVALSKAGPCVLGSRLAIWLLRDSALTVYLDAGLEVRAARIAAREGISVDEAREQTVARDKRDHDRYLKLYGYDTDTYEFAQLIIDAESLDQESIARRIIERPLA